MGTRGLTLKPARSCRHTRLADRAYGLVLALLWSIGPFGAAGSESIASAQSIARAQATADRTDAGGVIVDGRSLDDWRQAIGVIDYQDPSSTALVPGLIELAESDDVPLVTRRQAMLTLGRLGPLAEPGVEALLRLLDRAAESSAASSPSDDARDVSLWATKGLALYGPVAAPAVPRLIQQLSATDTDEALALTTVEALARVGAWHPLAIPTLMQLASGELRPASLEREGLPADTFRVAGCEGLELVGAGASVAVPLLSRLTAAPEGRLRRHAVITLGAIGPPAIDALESLLLVLLDDEDAATQDAAEVAIGRLGPAVLPAVAPLIDPARGDEALDEVSLNRLLRLTAVHPQQGRTLEPLVRARLTDPRPNVRLTAVQTLWTISGPSAELQTRLLRFLVEGDRAQRWTAARQLATLAEVPEELALEVQRLAEHTRAEVRATARWLEQRWRESGALL